MSLSRTVLLNNGLRMPILGFGTFKMTDKDLLKQLVKDSIKVGYRHIDTATAYQNEDAIGEALEEVFNDPSYGVSRKDIWITSKLSPKDQGYEGAYESVANSLKRLRTDYIDLYLVHWPFTSGREYSDIANKESRKQSWKALEELYEQKKLRSIGVSNYYINHIDDLLTYAKVVPAVNQMEYHPMLFVKEQVENCKKHGIAFEAYMSFVAGKMLDGTFNAEQLDEVAKKHGVTKAQVLLAWSLNRDIIVIPKASSESRLRQNFESQTVNLDQEDMEKIDSISKTMNTRVAPDPSTMV
ncbi:hypothetical protein BB559_004207 [Furculomyces boomerangus]|uniref:NADP-dependent oxidoreductase domain-containing protein n=2 Tax=Harpellales TaxID=61421 RepID=A0A2T9YFZ3_9FUNG|nr:hypothetical protein BB559_004207 [Furculomyces boomerangus]PVZ98851.1 hypothetical protein BB558_005142 [Smittium angustum]